MQIHNAAVTGSFTYNGIDISDITGSEQSVVSLNEFSASILNYTSSNNQSVATLQGATASLQGATSSLFAYTASLSGATSSLFAYTASNNANIAALNAATSSLYFATASIYGATSSLFNYSASSNLRIGSLEQYTASLNTRSASFACVDATNNFACTQYFSNTSNAVSFTSTGSIYSDGGVRITKDMYVSGTAFFNNVTVFGTQSVAYISSSQLNIGTNIISVNTDTPTIRFGGLAVYDSGSTGLTGSILWDSEDNQWIYSNPSGSTYDSAAFLVGPRNVGVLGNEIGISCNFLSKGNGMHHMTSSGIFEDGFRTCFYGQSYINSSGLACFNDTVCANTFKSRNLIVCEGSSNATIASSNNEVLRIQGFCQEGMFTTFVSGSTIIGDVGNSIQTFSSGNTTGFGINARGSRVLQLGTNQSARVTIASTGETTFSSIVCAPNATISSCLGVGVASPQGNFEAVGLSYFTRTNNSLLVNPNYGGANTHAQIQAICNVGIAFATNGDNERMRITNGGSVGIGTCAPNEKLTVWTSSTTGLQTALRLNNPFGFNNLNTGTQIVFSQDRSIAEDLKQGIIAVGQADAGTSATSFMAFYTNNTGLGERLRITSTGVACFSSTVCAPQYITTQGSSVSYAAGTNYIVWSSEGEVCACDTNTGGTYTTMKTWIADRTGCLTLRFAGYIQSGPNYWAWRVVRNGSTSLVCGDYLQPLAPGCSTSVHAYTTFQSNIGPVNPGDCITLQMVSSTGGGVPVNGVGQFLFAKELRLHSTTPNFSAGSPSNIFGDRLGVGTCIPGDVLHVERAAVGGTCMIIRNSCGASSLTNNYSILSLQLVGSGQTGQIGTNLIAGKELDYSSTANRDAFFAIQVAQNDALCERMRITSAGNVGIGTTNPNTILDVNTGINTSSGTAIMISQNTNGAVKPGASFGLSIQNGGESTNAADLWIRTANGGTLCERMRITSGGCVIVNGTSASSIMTIYPAAGSSDTLTFRTSGNTAAGALFAYSDGNGASHGIGSNLSLTSGGGANRFNGSLSAWSVNFDTRPASDQMTFNYVNTSGTYNTRMTITNSGQVQIGCGVNSMFYNGAGCRYNFTALNTPQQLVGICANNGIIVIRDHTTGGTGAFLIDPNMGVICIASNIPATVAIAYHSSAGMWCWCLTSGSVPRCLGYGFYGA